jgi:hypothetical protein
MTTSHSPSVRTVLLPRTDSILSGAIRVCNSGFYLQRTISEAHLNWRSPVQKGLAFWHIAQIRYALREVARRERHCPMKSFHVASASEDFSLANAG